MAAEIGMRRVCLIIGAGEGVGGAIARAFAADGFAVCVTRRARNLSQLDELVAEIRASGGEAHAFGVDARSEEETVALFDRIEHDIGPVEVVVFNIGANVRFGIRETTTRVFTKVWEMACLSGFLAGREAARLMVPRGRGTILFTGAKSALRAVAQSMARELGPQGIHVVHVIVDGSIDGVFSRANMPDIEARLERDEVLKPDDIARNFVWLHHQPRSAWTHEIDLRPWQETW
jgi:NAD(P)-dependent dehydrogenase (short-subunit alcohol dehydrogenase family)